VLLRWLVMVGILSVSGVGARAERPAKRVERLARQAGLAYRSADYAHAVALLEEAYRVRQVAALLYNAAKAYEKLGLFDEASDRYQRYVKSSDADPRLRSKAERRLVAIEARQTTVENERPMPPVVAATTLASIEHVEPVERTRPPPRVPEVAPQKFPAAAPPVVNTAPIMSGERFKETYKSRSLQKRRDRLIGSTLFGTGLAIAGIGAGLSVSAYLLHQQFATSFEEAKKRELKNSAEGQAIGGDVLYGLAAISVGVGIYYMWRGFLSESPPRRMTVVPIVGWSSAGLLFEGYF
jgi:tetratricopeptide (TPR) repeat protein